MRPKEKVEGTIHSAGLTALQTSAVAQLRPEAPAVRGCSNGEHEGCFRSAWLWGPQGAAVPPRPLAWGEAPQWPLLSVQSILSLQLFELSETVTFRSFGIPGPLAHWKWQTHPSLVCPV